MLAKVAKATPHHELRVYVSGWSKTLCQHANNSKLSQDLSVWFLEQPAVFNKFSCYTQLRQKSNYSRVKLPSEAEKTPHKNLYDITTSV